MLHARSAAVLAATAALVAAGCGGDDDSGGKTTAAKKATPTPTAYRAEVKARCQRYQKEREAAAKPLIKEIGNKQPSQLTTADMKKIAPVQAAVNATTVAVIKDVQAIPVPASLRSARDAALAAASAGAADQAAAATAMAAGDRSAMLAAFKKSDHDFGGAETQGREVGLNACG